MYDHLDFVLVTHLEAALTKCHWYSFHLGVETADPFQKQHQSDPSRMKFSLEDLAS